MGASSQPTQDFFGRLAALPFARQAHAAFDRLFLRASTDPAGMLYRELIAHLLTWFQVPQSAGGLNWEWRPLLLLQTELDPFYFTESQIARRIAECPPLAPEQRTALQRAIAGLLTLRRTGDLVFATALVPLAFQRKWTALVPPEFAWRSLDVLQAAGLYTLGTVGGFRSHARFTTGEFAPPLKPERMVAWEQVCDAEEAASELNAAAQTASAPSAAHRAAFLAAAFAGELTALGLDGPCGAAPRCDTCPLRSDCAWATAEAAAKGGVAQDAGQETLARARLGRAESLSLPALLDGLFALAPEEHERLRTRLKGQTLRSLSAKSATELEEWLGVESQTLPLDPARLLVLFELCKRFGEERLQPGAAFTGAQDVFRHFRLRFRDLKQERFLVVLLDIKKRFLSETLVSQGGLDSSPVHAREVFAPAVRERAAYVLLVHNHPSGDPTPSAADLDTTRALAKLGQVMGIPILDHVILGDERFVSLRESGLVDL